MTETPTPRRPRFSLRTLLTLTAWLAMGMTIFLQWRELAPLRAEVKKLRDETGKLWVEDESKLHAMQLETNQDKVWKWRLWLPPGKKYWVRYATAEIPIEGLPPYIASGFEVGGKYPGETVLTFCCFRSAKDRQWQCRLQCSGQPASNGSSIDGEWLETAKYSTFSNIGTSTHSYDDGKPVVLIRYLHSDAAQESSAVKNPSLMSGFMIWIEPAK